MFAFANFDHLFSRPERARPSILVRLLDLFLMVLILLVVLVLLLAPALAGNTTFLTDKNGNVVFPMSRPNIANGTPGRIDNMTIGATTPAAEIDEL